MIFLVESWDAGLARHGRRPDPRSGSCFFPLCRIHLDQRGGGHTGRGRALRDRLGAGQAGRLVGQGAVGRLGGTGDDIEIEHDNLSRLVVRPPGSPVFGFSGCAARQGLGVTNAKAAADRSGRLRE
ncbi:hypothetical protein FZ942_10410 [Azospirillum lipoferum]|uniref:Uncharacterized protein n=1 Tax=Azospirillum lipoferum TaxID=193 RepID=A0A5A9GT56_AZOLI|nr:hypothetical protein FZ942_10410 [Azospirillum lipoferum]